MAIPLQKEMTMSKTSTKDTAKLSKMKVNELQAMFAEVTGERTRSPNKVFLIRRITEALQAKEGEGRAPRAGTPRPGPGSGCYPRSSLSST
jgi:hypothetical protein